MYLESDLVFNTTTPKDQELNNVHGAVCSH